MQPDEQALQDYAEPTELKARSQRSSLNQMLNLSQWSSSKPFDQLMRAS